MITKLKLNNWRSHLDTEMNFSEGTNCFIGKMGSGKTSVLDAICFALFGTFPTLQSKKLKLRDIIMKKPHQKQEASVELTFNINDSEWNVKRTIDNNRSTAELRNNGKLVEAPQPTKVTDEIERILKMNYDLFTRAVYSEQNQIDMFLTIPKGQRMKKIDELLAIDKFESVRATTKQLVNKCNYSVAGKQQVIEDLKRDESIRNVEDMRREIIQLDDKNKMLERLLSEETIKRFNYENEISNLKDQERRLRQIEEKINLDVALINSAKVDIEKLKEDLFNVAEFTMEQLTSTYKGVETEYTVMNDNLEKEQKNFDRLKLIIMQKDAKVNTIENDKIPDIERMMKERDHIEDLLKKKKLPALEKELDRKKKDLEEKQAELQLMIARTDEIKISIKEMNSVEDSCPICDNKISEAKKKSIIEKKKERMVDISDNSKKIKIEIGKMQVEMQKVTEDIESVAHLKGKLEAFEGIESQHTFLKDAVKQIKEELSMHNNESSMLDKAISVMKKRVDQLRSERDRIKSLFEKRILVDDKQKMMKEWDTQIKELQEEKMRYSSISITRIESFEKELQSVIAKQSEIKTNLGNMANLVVEKKKRMADAESKLKMLDDYSAEIRKIEAVSDQFKMLESALILTQEQLRKNFVTTVNVAMQNLWSDIYPYEDIYDIRLSIDDGDYVLQLQDSSGWMNADGSASGGERSIACLTLRIAFALVLAPQLRWLVLDEPTANLDSKAVEDLATVLREKVGEFVDQIFLITHDPALETAVSGYLYRLDREKEKDGYTNVVCVSGPEN